ncbi:uncharacterized protein ARMOST_01997 [Armillaria ostoyae]|uniref:Uncharacterized protein n=1 Tax=Armillaria ostoyae TaxID=47428 RepID=A0A284QQK9_ARMOS|nr:uncharacterized protein ARMOST_01997 [Armillaria ostoyae]
MYASLPRRQLEGQLNVDQKIKGTMNATDAMLHLDAVERSVPEPIFPPDALNSEVSGILRATRPFLDTDPDWILPNIEGLQRQVSVYDTLLDRIDEHFCQICGI